MINHGNNNERIVALVLVPVVMGFLTFGIGGLLNFLNPPSTASRQHQDLSRHYFPTTRQELGMGPINKKENDPAGLPITESPSPDRDDAALIISVLEGTSNQ